MTNKDDSTYPHNFSVTTQHGLTKREYFAAMAMQGLITKDGRTSHGYELDAQHAVDAADALIKELDK